MGKGNFYITTPIYYVNDKPHIGHAYTTLACDIMARFKRLMGYDVYFITGTDEHGQKVQKSAELKGMDPQSFTDEVSKTFRDLTKIMNFSNDGFIRTTEERHKKSVEKLWKTLLDNGDIYLGKYKGLYATRDECFYSEDECIINKEGIKVAPTGAPVEMVEEESYFFRLSKYQDKLLKYYDDNFEFISPRPRRNEVINFVKSGLQDLSISRTSFYWGIKVPNDPKHVIYVWLDALTNYITEVGYNDDPYMFDKFWNNGKVNHVVGKDISRFHTIYWPAFLMSAGLKLPEKIFAHGWWTNEGQKISKSLGNVIDPLQLVNKYGLDQTRYYLMREVPFGQDGDFSHNSMVMRMNNELANDLGNLSQRTLSFIIKNVDGVIPEYKNLTEEDNKILSNLYSLPDRLEKIIDTYAFHEVIEEIWVLIRLANAYIDHQAPWALKKTDIIRMNTVLYVLAEIIRVVGIMLQPFIPNSSDKLLSQWNVDLKERNFKDIIENKFKTGHILNSPEPVFVKYFD